MPKEIPEREWDVIHDAIAGKGDGVGVAEIRAMMPYELPARTMQRRLKALEESGRIRVTGSGKGKRYFPKTSVSYHEVGPMECAVVRERAPSSSVISLSAAAHEVRELIRQPLAARTPVAYNPDFLGNYIPNRTAYLPAEIRRELAECGRVGVGDLPAGTYVRQVLDRLLIDLSWNSSRLEGNTYSLLETQRLLALGQGAEGRGVRETQMILNHKAAIEMLAEDAGEIAFNRYTLCNLHALLAENLLDDDNACGRVRSRAVGISGTVYHPLVVPQRVEEYFLEILTKAEAITDPFEQAFFVMVHLPYLQPFEDVNKRVSRLAANIPLIRHNLCPLSFVDVPQEEYVSGLLGVYELNRIDLLRDVFVWAYRRSAGRFGVVLQTLGEPDPFRLRHRASIADAVRAVVEGGMDKREAAGFIARHAASGITESERARFIEVVETALTSLHEGNIARFRLRPSTFQAWQNGWM
ncbi:MAG: Fic family protein [Luteolibacter sp.]